VHMVEVFVAVFGQWCARRHRLPISLSFGLMLAGRQ